MTAADCAFGEDTFPTEAEAIVEDCEARVSVGSSCAAVDGGIGSIAGVFAMIFHGECFRGWIHEGQCN